MEIDLKEAFHVESDPHLWKAKEWVGGAVRVIQTCVGAYGALDQRGGTTYFDVGDYLVKVFDQVVIIPGSQIGRYVEEQTV